ECGTPLGDPRATLRVVEQVLLECPWHVRSHALGGAVTIHRGGLLPVVRVARSLPASAAMSCSGPGRESVLPIMVRAGLRRARLRMITRRECGELRASSDGNHALPDKRRRNGQHAAGV